MILIRWQYNCFFLWSCYKWKMFYHFQVDWHLLGVYGLQTWSSALDLLSNPINIFNCARKIWVVFGYEFRNNCLIFPQLSLLLIFFIENSSINEYQQCIRYRWLDPTQLHRRKNLLSTWFSTTRTKQRPILYKRL